MSEIRHLPEIHKTTVINAPISKVWMLVATSEGIAAWFMPNTFEPVMGKEFVLRTGPYGETPCEVIELDPPHRLSFKWAKDWVVTIELIDLEGTTEVHLYHQGWDADKVTEFGQPHTAIRDNMDSGWTGIAAKLKTVAEQ